jgi:hypothetical protein
MSLKSFLEKIWAGIKTLFDKVPTNIKNAIHIGVVVTENIKTFVDSPVVDVLTALIPGDIDDKIKDLLRARLPVILTELKLADSCAALSDPNEVTACAIKVLQGITGDTQSAFFHNLSILIAQVAADDELSWSDGGILARMVLSASNINQRHNYSALFAFAPVATISNCSLNIVSTPVTQRCLPFKFCSKRYTPLPFMATVNF